MKLWDVLATCLLLLSSAVARPLYRNTQPAKRTSFPSSSTDSASLSAEDEEQTFQREKHSLQELSMEDQCKNGGLTKAFPLADALFFLEWFKLNSERFDRLIVSENPNVKRQRSSTMLR